MRRGGLIGKYIPCHVLLVMRCPRTRVEYHRRRGRVRRGLAACIMTQGLGAEGIESSSFGLYLAGIQHSVRCSHFFKKNLYMSARVCLGKVTAGVGMGLCCMCCVITGTCRREGPAAPESYSMTRAGLLAWTGRQRCFSCAWWSLTWPAPMLMCAPRGRAGLG